MQQEATLPFEPPRQPAEQQLPDGPATIVESRWALDREAGVVDPGDCSKVVADGELEVFHPPHRRPLSDGRNVNGRNSSDALRRSSPDRDLEVGATVRRRQLAEEPLEGVNVFSGVGLERDHRIGECDAWTYWHRFTIRIGSCES